MLVGCGLPEDRCVLDDHFFVFVGLVSRVEGCVVSFPKSGQASSWVDLKGSELHVAFYDACAIGDTLRSVRMTDDTRKVYVYRSSDRSGVITMPKHPDMAWMDLTVEVKGTCATTADFTVSR